MVIELKNKEDLQKAIKILNENGIECESNYISQIMMDCEAKIRLNRYCEEHNLDSNIYNELLDNLTIKLSNFDWSIFNETVDMIFKDTIDDYYNI